MAYFQGASAISFKDGNMALKMQVAKRDVVSKLLGKGYQSMCLASRSVLKNEVKDSKKKKSKTKTGSRFPENIRDLVTWSFTTIKLE